MKIRPARLSDLETIYSFAKSAGPGITSLPAHKEVLEKKLAASEQAFAQEVLERSHETYLFCLEKDERVIGISGIISRIGTSEPFFAYHIKSQRLKSEACKVDKKIGALHFMEARKKPTEVGSLYLLPEWRQKQVGTLLSFARFLFLGAFPDRFADNVIGELRGVNVKGNSPFWDALGRHFFDTTFEEANYLRAVDPQVIEELFPRDVIYPMLLPKEAQEVIGQVHQNTRGAAHMLEKQGFVPIPYVDIFDAGPHVCAQTNQIKVIQQRKLSTVCEIAPVKGPAHLLSNGKLDFRATTAPLRETEKGVVLSQETAQLLAIDIGETITYLEEL